MSHIVVYDTDPSDDDSDTMTLEELDPRDFTVANELERLEILEEQENDLLGSIEAFNRVDVMRNYLRSMYASRRMSAADYGHGVRRVELYAAQNLPDTTWLFNVARAYVNGVQSLRAEGLLYEPRIPHYEDLFHAVSGTPQDVVDFVSEINFDI